MRASRRLSSSSFSLRRAKNRCSSSASDCIKRDGERERKRKRERVRER